MRRSILAPFLAALVLIALSAPTVGAKSSAPDSTQEFAAGDVCGFAIRIDDFGQDHERTYTDRHGIEHTLLSGAFRTHVTNTESGKSTWVTAVRRLEIWQPDDATVRLLADGSTVFFFFPQDVGPRGQGPGLFLVIGHVDQTLDLEADAITSFRLRGISVDLCARID